ncbi:MAG: TIGR00725 family protein [Acidimicrobiales bacterium]
MAVVGGYEADADTLAVAEAVGRLLAERDMVVVTGGRQGVAEAASRGAALAGGMTVGILPGRARAEANPWVRVAVATGLGDTRNALVVMDADAVIAFPGLYGTLSEVAFALLDGTPVVGLGTWVLRRGGELDESIVRASSATEAVDLAADLIASASNSRP